MRYIQTMIALAVALNSVALAEESSVPTDEIRDSIRKSVPFIEREGWKWIRTKKCLSCHMITFMQWSLHEAQVRGIEVDAERLVELDDYVDQQQPKVDPEKKPKSGDTAAQIVLSSLSYSKEANLKPWITELTRSHRESGLWGAGGQLPTQKRPKGETQEVSTYWNLAALTSIPDSPDSVAAIQTATRKRLASGLAAGESKPKSTEWFTARLLSAVRIGDEDLVASARNELLKLQQEDGGWGWLTESGSDALATGPAIWALLNSGFDWEDDSIQRGVRFLLDTQRDDGTWRVESTRARDKGAVKHTSVYWGTTWAVIGLSQFLPETN